MTLCKEDPRPLARHLETLRPALDRAGLLGAVEVFVLSDTSGADLVAREEATLLPLHDAGALSYRRRTRNTGRKPGNIGDWVDAHGARFDHMLVLDADSRMTPRRIARMIWQMERHPALGLLQSGIALLPGQTRFGRHQRIAARLMSRGFGRGFRRMERGQWQLLGPQRNHPPHGLPRGARPAGPSWHRALGWRAPEP